MNKVSEKRDIVCKKLYSVDLAENYTILMRIKNYGFFLDKKEHTRTKRRKRIFVC